MAIPRRMRFIHGQLAWMLVALLMLTVVGALSYELFFVVSLLGLLIVTELTAPFSITPTWRRRLWVVIVIGLIGFAYVVGQRIITYLPPGVLPW